MKGFLSLTVLMLLFSFGIPEWWWIQLLPFVWGLLVFGSGKRAFGFGGLAGASAWAIVAALLWIQHGRYIVPRMAEVLQLHQPLLLFSAMLLVAFVAGGLASLTGYAIRQVFWRA